VMILFIIRIHLVTKRKDDDLQVIRSHPKTAKNTSAASRDHAIQASKRRRSVGMRQRGTDRVGEVVARDGARVNRLAAGVKQEKEEQQRYE